MSGKFPLRSETSSTLLFCFPGPVNVLFGFTLTTGRRYFYTRQLKATQFPKESLRTETGQGDPLWRNRSKNMWRENRGANATNRNTLDSVLMPAPGISSYQFVVYKLLRELHKRTGTTTVTLHDDSRSKQSPWHVTHTEETGEMRRWGEGRIGTAITKCSMFK